MHACRCISIIHIWSLIYLVILFLRFQATADVSAVASLNGSASEMFCVPNFNGFTCLLFIRIPDDSIVIFSLAFSKMRIESVIQSVD